jgi:hypothetical protein
MKYAWDVLERIHAKTDGRCHLCARRVALRSYGYTWESDHSNARANGGSHRLNNLYPACISCNRSKGARNTRTFRRRKGLTRAPMSAAEQFDVSLTRVAGFGLIGTLVGNACHPNGAKWGALVGGLLGGLMDPED